MILSLSDKVGAGNLNDAAGACAVLVQAVALQQAIA
jgi:hypothetical protein